MCWNANSVPDEGSFPIGRTVVRIVFGTILLVVLFAALGYADERDRRYGDPPNRHRDHAKKKDDRNVHEKLVDGIERRGKAHREVRRAIAKSLGIIESRDRNCDPYHNYGRSIYLQPRGGYPRGYNYRSGRCEARFNRYWRPYCTHPQHRYGYHRWTPELFVGFEFPHMVVVLNNRAFCMKRYDGGRYHGYGCDYIHGTDYYRSWRSRETTERAYATWDAAAGGYSIYDEYPGEYVDSEMIIDPSEPLDLRPRDDGPLYDQRPEAKWGPVENKTWDGQEAICRRHGTTACVIVLKPIIGKLTELVDPMWGPDNKLHTTYCSEGSCR